MQFYVKDYENQVRQDADQFDTMNNWFYQILIDFIKFKWIMKI